MSGHAHSYAQRALAVAFVLNALYLLVESAAGWWTGSLALLSDAAHMLGDVAALALAYVAARLARRPASPRWTFGLIRAEVLGAFLNAIALLVACAWIFSEAIARLLAPATPIPGWPILGVAVVGLVVNLGSAAYLWRSDRHNLNVRGALAHMLADALGSVGAIVAAALAIAFGWYRADVIASMLIGGLVVVSGWSLLRDSTVVLLQFAPVGLGGDAIKRTLEEVEGVAGAHDVHVWVLSPGRTTVTAHLTTTNQAIACELIERASQVLREQHGVHHATLQVEPDDSGCGAQLHCPALEGLHG